MKLNLKYYKGKDEYSDGIIEDKILDYIDQYSNDLGRALNKDNSWPVVYHLSKIRENVINWYDFKENSSILEIGAGMGAITSVLCEKCKSVTSVELSKKRANSILKRNKDRKNLEIIVGNFNDIKFTKKYDYVLLNGVLEYAALYINSSNPYRDILNRVKKLLKKDGHILIAIENRTGLKYWAGAYEDHTGIIFDGITNYQNKNDIKTFTKHEIERLIESLGLKCNFYYMFPDYKFPELIFSDDSLKKNIYCNYGPYYYKGTKLFFDERKLFDDIYNNNMIPFFANSFFIDVNKNGNTCDVEFVKFNNYRNENYSFFTYLKNNKFYKHPLNNNATKHLENIVSIYNILNKNNKIVEIKKENNEIYSKMIKYESVFSIIDRYYNNNNVDGIIQTFKLLYNYLKNHSGNVVKNNENIFKKYNIKTVSKIFTYYEDGILDFIPSNIYYHNGNIVLIDQEWYEKNCPIEFIMYRCINNYFNYYKDGYIKKMLYKQFNIEDNLLLFQKLESRIFNDVNSNGNEYFNAFYTNSIIIENVNKFFDDYDYYKWKCNELEKSINKIEKQNNELEDNYNKTIRELNSIYNSRGYRLLQKFYIIKSKLHLVKKERKSKNEEL